MLCFLARTTGRRAPRRGDTANLVCMDDLPWRRLFGLVGALVLTGVTGCGGRTGLGIYVQEEDPSVCEQPIAGGFSRRFGGEQWEQALSVAVRPCGNIVVTGAHRGKLDFGQGELESDTDGIFLVTLDPAGEALWSRTFPLAMPELAELRSTHVALGDQGQSFLMANFSGSVDFGGGMVHTGSGLASGVAYARFDEHGNHLESRAIVDACDGGDTIEADHASLLPDASAILTLSAWGKPVLGGVTLEGECGEQRQHLARLAPGGDLAWSTEIAYFHAADTDDSGTTYTGGNWQTSSLVDKYGPDGHPLSLPHVYSPGAVAVAAIEGGGAIVLEGSNGALGEGGRIIRMSSEGLVLWKRSLPADIGRGLIGADAAGNAYLATTTSSAVDLGTGVLEGGSFDIVVAKFSGANGETISAMRSHREPKDDTLGYVLGMAVSSAGEVILAGGFNGLLDLGHGPLVSAGENDIFVAKLEL